MGNSSEYFSPSRRSRALRAVAAGSAGACAISRPAAKMQRWRRCLTPLMVALFGLGNDADVRLGGLPALRISLLGFVLAYVPGDDDVIALLPVHGRGNLVLRRKLYGIENAQHL